MEVGVGNYFGGWGIDWWVGIDYFGGWVGRVIDYDWLVFIFGYKFVVVGVFLVSCYYYVVVMEGSLVVFLIIVELGNGG